MPRRGPRRRRAARTAGWTCWSTTPVRPGGEAFGETGWENLERHMRLNFEAPVRLTEALLPLLREHRQGLQQAGGNRQRRQHFARASRARMRARTRRASSRSPDGATRCTREERPTGSMSGWCFPASSPPRVFPRPSCRATPVTRWLVSKPERVAEAILDAGPGGKAERYVPRLLLAGGGAADPGARAWSAGRRPAARLRPLPARSDE